MQNYDVVIIGAGPGGDVSAIRASQLGLKVAIIDREHLGGVCLNWGCIPTKALLKSAEVLHMVKNAAAYGVNCDFKNADLQKMVQRSRDISGQLSKGIGGLLKKNKITHIQGEASFIDKKTLSVLHEGKKENISAICPTNIKLVLY